jgi:hypothetical protein
MDNIIFTFVKTELQRLSFISRFLPAFFLMLFIFKSLPAFSQHYEFENLGHEEGLIGSIVFSSIEDEKGYMWFISDKTICRYDGTHFKAFGSDEGYTESGGFHIYKDKRNRIWVLSFNFKLFYFDGQKFRQFRDVTSPCWLAEDDAGYLWIGNRMGSLYKINNDAITDSVKLDVPEIIYNFIITDRNHILLTRMYHIDEILYGRTKELPLKLRDDFHVASRLFPLRNGNILLTNYKGIYVRKNPEEPFKLIYPFKKGDEILCFYEDSLSHDLFVGGRSGVIRFRNGKINTENAEKYFDEITINSIKKSREGFYWFCTDGHGLYYGNLTSLHFSKADGLLSNDIRYIRNAGNDIYAMSWNGELSLLNRTKVVPYKQNITQDELMRVIFLFKLQDGTIYVGANSNLFLYRLHNRILKRVPLTDAKKDYPFFSSSGKILFPSLNLGDSVFYYVEDKDLFKARKNDLEPQLLRNTHMSNTLGDVDITEKGTLILQTKENGLILVKNNKFDYITTANGLVSNYGNTVYYNDHKIWVCTDYGLSKVILDKDDRVLKIVNFTSENFLASNEVRDVIEYGGRVYVGTARGLSVFNEEESNKNMNVSPGIYIKEVTINNRDTTTDIRDFTLPYYENNISIEYSAISFNGAAGTIFKYKLEGTDQSFNYTSNSSIQFANLAPGDYRFVVYARNSLGNWSRYPESIRFTIKKPYWKTGWFIALCSAAGMAVIAYFILIRIRIIRKENRFRHQLVQSELRALRLYMNPHFIFNSLNSLRVLILKNNPAEADSYIISFSRLIRTIMSYSSRSSISIEEEKELLIKYIELEQKRFTEVFAFNIIIDPLIDTHDTHIPPLIIQPFVENAIKHGLSAYPGSGVLTIEFSLTGTFICCVVTDNGIGRQLSGSKQLGSQHQDDSTGIRYIEERLKLLVHKEDFTPVIITDLYHEGKASGTTVKLLIPIL